MSRPAVSILVNCFNGEQTLKRCLDSIFAQTFNDWEIIFWDNLSTDSSADIAKSFGAKVKYFKSKHKTNLSEARCHALERCTGEYVAFLDVDDSWYPKKLELQLAKIRNTDFIVCYGGVTEVSSEGVIIRSIIPSYKDGNQFKEHLVQFDINMVTPLIKMDALKKHGITFDPNIVASEEYNIFMRLALVGDFCSVDKVLGEWVINEDSLTNQSISSWSEDRRYTLDKIISENIGINVLYAKEFQAAYAGSDYYEARFFISQNKWEKARKLLKKNAFHSPIFFALWMVSMCRPLWRFIHNEKIKRRLSMSLLKRSKRYSLTEVDL